MKRIEIKNILLSLFMVAEIMNITVFGQTVRAPLDTQVDLIPKILALDKNFNPEHEKKICNIGIIYNSRQKSSYYVLERIMWYSSGKEISIKNCKSKMIPIDISKNINLRRTFDKNHIKAIYIAPLGNYDIPMLTKICKEKMIRTFTGVNSFFTHDISVMFDLNNFKFEININLSSAKGEGIDFSAYLLNIAELTD